MNARFYAPDVRGEGEQLALPKDEAAHLVRVLRLKPGAPVVLFDGRGHEFDGVVRKARNSIVIIEVGPSRTSLSEVKVAITLAQAVLKGDKMDEVIRDAVMMGVASIQPVVTSRSEITLASLTRGRRQERWQRITVSSAKQCGRATIPTVREPRSFDAVADDLTHLRLPGPGFMLVEPSALAGAQSLTELDPSPPREATLLIGPEGGWTSDEITRASASCRLLTLGRRTVRADVMPVVALAALFTHWREF